MQAEYAIKVNIMMKTIFRLFTTALLACVSILAYADDDHEKAKRLLESGDILALETVLQNARSIQPGKILEVELETEKGQKVYEIELLTSDGTILELLFDARTGEHISTKNED